MKKINEINEDTTTAAHPDIATSDENLSADDMFQQSLLPSLGRQIFPVYKIYGPTGAIFNIIKNPLTNHLMVVRNNVEVYPSTSIPTGITQEAIQDIKSQYGKEANIIIGKLLRGLANDQENEKTLTFLDDNCLASTNLELTDSKNAQTNLFEISQKVTELVIKTNTLNMRSLDAFAVIPYQALSGIMSLTKYAGSTSDKINDYSLFVGQIGHTEYYLNPDATSSTAYVGINDEKNPNRSSAFFSPYESQIVEATDPDTGGLNHFIFNRFAITASPLHVTDNEMLHKFDIVL